jgi:hypothetical protein
MELGVSVAVAQCLTTTHDTIGISFQLNVQFQTAITRKVFGFRPSVALANSLHQTLTVRKKTKARFFAIWHRCAPKYKNS